MPLEYGFQLPWRPVACEETYYSYIARHELYSATRYEAAPLDEDQEQDPGRWCSPSAWGWGQESWHIISQWVWNLRLELGHHLQPEPVRSTKCAPAQPAAPASVSNALAPVQGYRPAEPGQSWKRGRFSGRG